MHHSKCSRAHLRRLGGREVLAELGRKQRPEDEWRAVIGKGECWLPRLASAPQRPHQAYHLLPVQPRVSDLTSPSLGSGSNQQECGPVSRGCGEGAEEHGVRCGAP